MGLVKGILLGSAAGLVMATGTAFAADLPSRKAAPVAYVKICDVYGRGFYFIPGTNTCLKVGGRVRFELAWHKAQNRWSQGTAGVGGGAFSYGKTQDTIGWKARVYINMDARTQTAWGTVQTVFSVALRNRSGIFNAGGGFGPGGGGAGGAQNSIQVYAAYIRFAGFTFGRAPWLFAAGPGFLFYSSIHTGGSAPGNLQISYTAVFGGGFSATIGIHEKGDTGAQNRNYRVDTVSNLFGAPATAPVHPDRLPNLVIALRVDQGWGFAKLSVAVSRVHAVFGGGAPGSTTINKTGWAVGAVTRIKLPSIAKGDSLWLYAAYCNGAIDYCSSATVNGNIPKDGRRMGGYVPTHANVTFFNNAAGRVAAENTKAFTAAIVFTHYWTPMLRSNFGVSYHRLTPGSNSKNADWFGPAVLANGFSAGGQPTSTNWTASANIIWSPTRGFDLGLEAYYSRTKNSLACPPAPFVCTTWAGSGLAALGVKQNPSDVMIRFRAQRTF